MGRETSSREAKRLLEIDRVKGLAIVWVICIHAKVGEGTAVFEYVINRAVPILLVSFGLTSETWWEGRQETVSSRLRVTLDWYSSRLRRLLPPVVASGAVWCVVASWWGRFPESRGVPTVVAALLGYLPWAGTSWFIPLILQLVLAFPAMRWTSRRVPAWLSLPLAALMSSLSVWFVWEIVSCGARLLGSDVPQPAWYYQWVFVPRVLWPVAAGMGLAHARNRSGWLAIATCTALIAIEPFLIAFVGESESAEFVGPLRKLVIMQLFDVPLAIAVMGAFHHLRLPLALRSPLERLGRASWGIYLGHALLFEVIHLSGRAPEESEPRARWLYAVLLLIAGGVAGWGGGMATAALASIRRGARRPASAR